MKTIDAHPTKLIEVALPLPEINDASACDKIAGAASQGHSSITSGRGEVRRLSYQRRWYYVYDFIGRSHARFHTMEDCPAERTNLGEEFQQRLNQFFVKEGIGWKLREGEGICLRDGATCTRGPRTRTKIG